MTEPDRKLPVRFETLTTVKLTFPWGQLPTSHAGWTDATI